MWVSVNERLPKNKGRYLVVLERTAPDELGGCFTSVKIMGWSGNWRYAVHFPKWVNGKITEAVTHWMPLPKLPGRENKNGD